MTGCMAELFERFLTDRMKCIGNVFILVWCRSLKHRYLCIRILVLPNLISFLFLFSKTLHFIVGTNPQEQFLKYVKLTEKKFSA